MKARAHGLTDIGKERRSNADCVRVHAGEAVIRETQIGEDLLRLLQEDKGIGNKLLMNLLRNLSLRVRDLSEHVAIGR